MPATTDNLNIPYPIAGDRVADYPAVAKQAADKIDQLSYSGTLSTIVGWTSTSAVDSQTLQCRVIGGRAFLHGAICRTAGSFTLTAWKKYDIATVTPKPKYGAMAVVPANFNGGWIHVVIGTNGTVYIESYAQTSIANRGWLTLDGVSYVVES